MNNFDKHWQECAARARQEERADEQVPFGFATRVLAVSKVGSRRPATEALYRLTLRALACTATLVLVLAVLEMGDARKSRLDVPPIENTVAQIFWML
jgi:hypothetical protein